MMASEAPRLRLLIVDADEAARRRLRALLNSVESFASLDEAASAAQAAAMIPRLRPDLVLLDFDGPDASAFEPPSAAEPPCLAVITARRELALPGFELDAVDCLLRPLTRERLAVCLARARRRLAERRIAQLALEIAGAAALIRGPGRGIAGGDSSRYPERMTIRVRRRMIALPVGDIRWIEGASQYSRIHAQGCEYLLSRSLSSLECELDPRRFFRIHRSAIVNGDCVHEVMSRGDGRYDVFLKGGPALPLGRARRDVLDRLLGGLGRGEEAAPAKAG
jgi:two-component system, LytTR family, response regulator